MAKHILVVDDNVNVRAIIWDMLEDEDYQVSVACDGGEMRSALAPGHTVDAVILDCNLPGEPSEELALHAKELGLPVVMMSGYLAMMQFAQKHRLPLLRKPFGGADLLEALNKAFESEQRPRR